MKKQDMNTNEAVQKIIDTHGGEDFWNNLEALEAEISTSGLLFTFKRRPVLEHIKVTAYTQEPRFVFHDFPSPGLTGELMGANEVRVVSKRWRYCSKKGKPPIGLQGPESFALLGRSGFHLFRRLCNLELSGYPVHLSSTGILFRNAGSHKRFFCYLVQIKGDHAR